MKSTALILTFGAALAAFSAVAADVAVDLSKLPPASTKKGVTYAADIEPIFKASCYNCHSAQSARAPRKNLRLDSLEAALKGSDDGKVITPGKSETSSLVIAVARIDSKLMMPPAPRGAGRGPRAGAPGGTNAPAGGAAAGGPPGAGPGGPGGPGGGRGPAGPPAKNLTPEEVGLVRAWIDQGAK